jgi:para-aminobenzoate synthetase component 1
LSKPALININADKLAEFNEQSVKSIFALLSDQPWAMWLDSCDSNHIDSHFDILVWQPQVTLTTRANKTSIHYISTHVNNVSNDDPLLLLEQEKLTLLEKYQLSPSSLPFQLGAVGYFSYDLGRRFERLPNSNRQEISAPDMAVGLYLQALVFDRRTQEYWLICPKNKRQEITQYLVRLLSNKKYKTDEKFSLTTPWQSNINKSDYQKKFQRIQDYLLAGDCYQINLAQRFKAHYQGDEFDAYCALRESNQAPFSAFLRFDNFSILSISPERFLQLQQGKVQSKPIKGTKPRSDDPKQDIQNSIDLKNSEKDRAENLMIVDLLRNDISKVCQPSSVIVPSLFAIESFPAVHHLVSTVEGQLSQEFSASDLLRASFPGGSITGAPKIRAMEIIDELEPANRSVYCGSIGYLSFCGNMDSSITIRTLICENTTKTQNIYCWAGGGIVADSNMESEYQETYDKVNKILPILSSL